MSDKNEAEARDLMISGAMAKLDPEIPEAIRKLNATPQAVWDELRDDLLFFGVACSRRKADGTIERVDPKDVMLKASTTSSG